MTDSATRDLDLTEEDVREEHLRAVNATAHWIYLGAVLVGSFLLNLGLIALLASMK